MQRALKARKNSSGQRHGRNPSETAASLTLNEKLSELEPVKFCTGVMSVNRAVWRSSACLIADS
jgi:hypothetical protein